MRKSKPITSPGKIKRPSVREVAHRSSSALFDLTDPHTGPLAEAVALANVLYTIEVDKLSMGDYVAGTLAMMLRDRLDSVQATIEAEVVHV